MNITIFYSWISNYNNSNKSFIRKCIKAAMKKIEKDSPVYLNGVSLRLLESLGDAPGHQQLAQTQEQEIRNSDIFIGDWTVTDPYNCFERFRANHLSYERERNINPNVLHEYECFTASNGYDGAILVMDATRGSAKEENKIIPIDLRGRRFPIEYLGNNAEQELTKDIYEALKCSIPAAIKHRKNRFSPLHTWYEQNEKASLNTVFYENERLQSLKELIKTSQKDLRIVGLSGIGKTRIVHEAFRNEADSFYRNNYLYVQYSSDESGCIKDAIDTHIQDKEDNCVLVVDNCPPAFARKIQRAKRDYQANNLIITLYNRQDEDQTDMVQDVDYIEIHLEDVSSVVDDILNDVYSQISEDKKKIIKEFSAGLPMMAVILAENVKNGRVDFTTIPNNELVEKLLDTNDGKEKEILMSCSMFTHIGYRNECYHESKFIICNSYITPGLTGDACAKMTLFQRAFEKYSTREIFEKQGRYFAIRPIPLALKLAEDWLSGCNEERMLNVISEIREEDNKNQSQLLTSAFANQMANLAGNPKAKKIVSIITGNNSPFANAEVLNTELGSRLFRSFVEVDPVAVSLLFWRVFGAMTTPDLLNIKEGRRNLIWTIQKLAFDKRTFFIGAKLLIKFSLAENEDWGNNATNEALTLFHVYLPGTEADLTQRFEIIKWVRNLEGADDLFLKILSSALTSHYYSYFSGAETQGANKLEHYQPSAQEIIDYWKQIVVILEEFTENNPKLIEKASEIVTSNFMGLIQVGVQDIAFSLAELIAEKRKWDWNEMRDTLKLMFWHDGTKDYSEELSKRLKAFLAKLTKDDLISRLRDVESYESDNLNDERNRKNELYKHLAIELSTSHSPARLLEEVLSNSTISPSSRFGAEIYNCIKKNKGTYKSISAAIIDVLSQKNDYANNILIGFFGHADAIDFEYAYSLLMEKMPEALFPLYAIRGKSLTQCSELFDLVQTGHANVYAFDKFCCFYGWSNASHDDIIDFYDRLSKISSDGADIAMMKMNNILYFDAKDGHFSFIQGKYKEMILSEVFPVRIDNDTYMRNIETIIDKYDNPDIALFISKQIISYFISVSSLASHGGYHLDSVLRLLFNKYFNVVWTDWAKALAEPENFLFAYKLKFELGNSIGGLTGGALFGSDHNEDLKKWCIDYPETAPIILAMYIPVYSGDSLSPLAKFLLDHFGDNKRVLSELSCNLGSFSCFGSAVPIYEQKKHALQELVPHKNPTVNTWLLDNIRYAENDIIRETDRDAEQNILYR